MNLIQQLEQEEIARVSVGKTIPEFSPGDTVVVQVKVKEGNLASAGLRRCRHCQAQSWPELQLHRPQDFLGRGR